MVECRVVKGEVEGIPRGFLFGMTMPGLTYLFDFLRTKELPCLKYVAKVDVLYGMDESCLLYNPVDFGEEAARSCFSLSEGEEETDFDVEEKEEGDLRMNFLCGEFLLD